MGKPEWMKVTNIYSEKLQKECSLPDYDRYYNAAEHFDEGVTAGQLKLVDHLLDTERSNLDLHHRLIDIRNRLLKEKK